MKLFPSYEAIRVARFVFVAVLLCPRAALAQSAPAPAAPVGSEAEAAAENHLKRGLDLRRAGDDDHALSEFEQANGLSPSQRARAQIGLALSALGRWREAEETLLAVVADETDPWVVGHAPVLRESLAGAQQHLSWLAVESNVPGAELLINGVAAGTLPLAKLERVVAGVVVIEVRAKDYEPVRRTIEIAAGVRAREFVTLVALRPAVVASSAPGVGGAPAARGASRRAVGWTAIGAGALGVIGGAASLFVAAVNEGTYNDDAQCYFGGESRDQRCGVQKGVYQAATVSGVIALSLGAIATAAGAVLIVTSPSPPRDTVRASVACGVGLGTFECGAHF